MKNLEIGTTGTLKYGDDGTTARVVLVDTHEYYWFDYMVGETNRKISHPYYGKIPYIKGPIMFPKHIDLIKVFIPDNYDTTLDGRLDSYLKSIKQQKNSSLKALFSELIVSDMGKKMLESEYLIPNGF